MLKLEKYIESGILELYALGKLPDSERVGVERMLATYSVLQNELAKINLALATYAQKMAITPRSFLKDQIINEIVNLQKEKAMDMNDLPLLSKYSDHLKWLTLAHSFGEMPLTDGKFIKVLRQDEQVTQLLVLSATDIEEEVHKQEKESFLILRGECSCTIADTQTLMTAGDFMEIPMYQPHDVKVLKGPVMAILQHVKLF